jgi:hypothetical protein
MPFKCNAEADKVPFKEIFRGLIWSFTVFFSTPVIVTVINIGLVRCEPSRSYRETGNSHKFWPGNHKGDIDIDERVCIYKGVGHKI